LDAEGWEKKKKEDLPRKLQAFAGMLGEGTAYNVFRKRRRGKGRERARR